jgi:hypothetical protein
MYPIEVSKVAAALGGARVIGASPDTVGELAAAVAGDPVERYRQTLLADGVVDAEWLGTVEDEVERTRRELLEAFAP